MDPDYIANTAAQLGIRSPHGIANFETTVTRLQQAEREAETPSSTIPLKRSDIGFTVSEDEDFDWSSKPTSNSLDPKGEAGSKKAPLWLLPHHVKMAASWVLGLGARKYGPWNWRKTRVCASTYLSAIQRHLGAWEEREDTDPESGQNHLAHIIANCAILMDAQKHDCLEDDRP